MTTPHEPTALRDRFTRRDGGAIAVTGISELARTAGVTVRAIRHYEDKGLIRSQRTRLGARVFTAHQCQVARLVVMLRRLDVAIADIRPLVDGSRSEADRLDDLRKALEDRAADLARRLAEVRAALAAPVSRLAA